MEDLSAVSVFVSVVDAGSFAAAADRLGVVRSVVSRRIATLEDRLGTRLLQRTTRRLSLTATGKRFYERVKEGLDTINEAEREVSALRTEPVGKLVVSLPMSFGLTHIVPALPSFHANYPQITLELRFDDTKAELVRDNVDVALRIADLVDSSMVARRIAKIRHVLVASPAYLGRHGELLDPGELSTRECLIYGLRSTPRRWSFQQGDVLRTVHVNGHLEANNSLALRQMARAGMGLALIPLFLVSDDIQQGTLASVLPDWETHQLDLCAVFPTRRFVAPAIRAFIQFVEATVGTGSYR
ncbi:LysR family transcriptional regulator [Burkholderia cenocepacia]|nr:LysR family transcriptional regulator [Burkholderia cenocepacia]RQZ85428.1 LysR family transcriptional regulator [Burkholderia cenocepacia]RRA05968.1 LysR family transcriptional regulator [Burkholderia cenocepacia]